MKFGLTLSGQGCFSHFKFNFDYVYLLQHERFNCVYFNSKKLSTVSNIYNEYEQGSFHYDANRGSFEFFKNWIEESWCFQEFINVVHFKEIERAAKMIEESTH